MNTQPKPRARAYAPGASLPTHSRCRLKEKITGHARVMSMFIASERGDKNAIHTTIMGFQSVHTSASRLKAPGLCLRVHDIKFSYGRRPGRRV